VAPHHPCKEWLRLGLARSVSLRLVQLRFAKTMSPKVAPPSLLLGAMVKFPPFRVVISATALVKVNPLEPMVLLVNVCA